MKEKLKRGEGRDAETLYEMYEEEEESKAKEAELHRGSSKKTLRSFEMKYTTGMSLRRQLEEKFGEVESSSSSDPFEEPHRDTEVNQQIDEKESKNFRSGYLGLSTDN